MEFAITAPVVLGADNSYQACSGRGPNSTEPRPEAGLWAGFFFEARREIVHVLVQIGLVSVGGALGSVLRWGVGSAFGRLVGTDFPWGTFFINVSGSLFLGWFSTAMTERFMNGGIGWLRTDDLRLLVAVGFTGGYTTFSTFEYESVGLLRDGDGLQGLTYIFGSVFLGLVSVRLGMALARTA
jgi:CrcB protein